MTDIPNRTVEMYRLLDENQWDKVMVEIPANTPPNKLEEVARIHAVAQHGTCSYMLYNSRDEDCPEDMPQRSEVNVRLSFDMGQTSVGSEKEQEAAAIEQINLTLQRQPFGLGARLEKIT